MELGEKLHLLQSEGLNLRTATIYIVGELDQSMGMALWVKYDMIKEYHLDIEKELKEINIVISSIGGDTLAIFSMLDFYDILLKDGIKVNVLVEGNCMSATTFIVAGATGKRMATRRCRFMAHNLSASPPEGTQAEQKAFQLEVEREQQELYELYAHWTLTKKKNGAVYSKDEFKKTVREWKHLCEKEHHFSSEEAIKYGFVDIIVN